MKKNSFFSIIGVITVIAAIGAAVYYFFAKKHMCIDCGDDLCDCEQDDCCCDADDEDCCCDATEDGACDCCETEEAEANDEE